VRASPTMPAFTSESGMIAGGGPDGTIARRRTPLPPDLDDVEDTDVAPGAARDVPGRNTETKSEVSAAKRTETPARRTKP